MSDATSKYRRQQRARAAAEADKGPTRQCQICCLRYAVTPTSDQIAPLHTVRAYADTPAAHVCVGSGLTRREQSAIVTSMLTAKLHAYALRQGTARRGKA